MNVIIYMHMPTFNFEDGGTVVQYFLAQKLEKLGHNVRICTKNHIPNTIFCKYYNNDFPINDDTIVIYCEGVIGNPLNARKVVRWMLSELGQNVPIDFLNTWSKKELVYYFNYEKKLYEQPKKIGSIYKLLTSLYLDPSIRQINFDERTGICYTIRKAHEIHKKGIRKAHPSNSFEITRDHSKNDCIKIFNTHKWFMCYDSITFLYVMSALCGCIPVIYKVEGLSKKDWINTTAFADYFKYKDDYTLYGVAYGKEEMKFAEDTIHLANDQLREIIAFCNNKTIEPFSYDIQNFDKMINTIENNF